jgi:hypothetical protein
MDTRTNVVWYRIQGNKYGTKDSDSFFGAISEVITEKFLRHGNVLVLHNSKVHTGRANEA